MNQATELDPAELRPLLHRKLDELSDSEMSAAHRALLEIEMRRLVGDLDEATERLWDTGELSDEKISEAVRKHRQKHPYR